MSSNNYNPSPSSRSGHKRSKKSRDQGNGSPYVNNQQGSQSPYVNNQQGSQSPYVDNNQQGNQYQNTDNANYYHTQPQQSSNKSISKKGFKVENFFLTRQLQTFLDDKIEEINDTPISIGITGDSGSGKSTLINTLRGLTSHDIGAAKVGSVETTTSPIAYEHPNFKNVIFWDLPGVGTPSFPQSDYVEKLEIREKYDFFLIVIAGRFSENDLWLAKVLQRMRKPYFFIRSKLDIDLANKRRNNPNLSDEEFIEHLRYDITKNVRGLREIDVFILSGELENCDRWDFPLLRMRILEVMPEVKKNALTLSFVGYADDLIERKYQALKKRLRFYAAASALGALPPIPGFSLGVDTALFLRMGTDFTKSFGLTEVQVAGFAKTISTRTKVFNVVGRASAMLTTKAIAKLIASQAAQATAEEIVRYVPFVGQAAAAALSFTATYSAGKILLKRMMSLAKEISTEIANQPVDLPDLDQFSPQQRNQQEYNNQQSNNQQRTNQEQQE